MAETETLLSFVNRWECDENDHLNVKFYAWRFEEAGRQFFVISGLSEQILGKRQFKQIRFIRESLAGMLLKVNSWISISEDQEVRIIHEMIEVSSEHVIATAVDGYRIDAGEFPSLQSGFAEYESESSIENLPKGRPVRNFPKCGDVEELIGIGAFSTHRNTVLPSNCGIGGKADDFFIVGCFSDCAAHVWERAHLTKQWLEENDYGRMALEIKISYGCRLNLDDSVHIVSGFSSVGRRTLGLRHHMFNTSTGELAAVGDIVGAILDLSARQTAPLPDSTVNKLKEEMLPSSY